MVHQGDKIVSPALPIMIAPEIERHGFEHGPSITESI